MNTKKLKKAQIVLVYSLFGCICGISFVILLLSHQLYNIKVEKTLNDLSERSNYTLVFKEAKRCTNQKYTLFSWEGYDFSGVCIKDVYLSYNNLTIPLKTILKKDYLKIKDLFKNTIKKEENNYIELYNNEKENYNIIVNKPVSNYKEVIFSKGS